MKITIIGTGYVGLVTGVGLAEMGHIVYCVDTIPEKIALLKKGQEPFYEPGLSALLKKNIKAQRLFFTTDLKSVINKSGFILVCVGTPPQPDGGADLSYVTAAAKEIKKLSQGKKYVIIKSTVPIGTNAKLEKMLNHSGHASFEVISWPEFLREGKAVYDFFNPDRLVIGAESKKSGALIAKLFTPANSRMLLTNRETAELTKYASNSFLATKISFINDVANLCERVGANVAEVAYGMGLDPRISPHFLKAGLGYGGSCFPKDVKALVYIADKLGYDFKILKAVIEVNDLQRQFFVAKIKKHFGSLKNKKIAVLGLSFKEGTDDLRESAAIDVVKALVKAGAKVSCYDPQAMANAKKILPASIYYGRDAYDIMNKAEALVIATEWPQFAGLKWAKVKKLMAKPVLFDGKNLLDPFKIKQAGFKYYSVGR